MIVLADDLAAVAVEHDQRGRAAAAPAARLAERVRRQVGGGDGRGRHGAHLPLEGHAVARKRRSVPELVRLAGSAPRDSLGRSIALVAAGTPG